MAIKDLSQLASALEEKKNDINNFIWKGARKEVNGVKVQEEIKLMDASNEQLKQFYNHCKTMLYNTDKNNPGRYVVKDLIYKQRIACNAELMMRYLENQYLPNTNRVKYPRFQYLQDLRVILNNNREVFPMSMWSKETIDKFTGGLPEEFHNLSVETVLDACLDQLGVFDKKHLTLTFITKLGIWLTAAERREFNKEKDENGKQKNYLDIIRERNDINNNLTLTLNSDSGLTYEEFRSMIQLRTKKYSELTTNQLLILRNKILFKLEDEVDKHISQWETLMNQIKQVAEVKGYELD